MKDNSPKYEPQEVIKRLIQEQNHTSEVLSNLRRLLTVLPELEGHSLVGGVKALIKMYLGQRKRAESLKDQLDKVLLK